MQTQTYPAPGDVAQRQRYQDRQPFNYRIRLRPAMLSADTLAMYTFGTSSVDTPITLTFTPRSGTVVADD